MGINIKQQTVPETISGAPNEKSAPVSNKNRNDLVEPAQKTLTAIITAFIFFPSAVFFLKWGLSNLRFKEYSDTVNLYDYLIMIIVVFFISAVAFRRFFYMRLCTEKVEAKCIYVAHRASERVSADGTTERNRSYERVIEYEYGGVTYNYHTNNMKKVRLGDTLTVNISPEDPLILYYDRPLKSTKMIIVYSVAAVAAAVLLRDAVTSLLGGP